MSDQHRDSTSDDARLQRLRIAAVIAPAMFVAGVIGFTVLVSGHVSPLLLVGIGVLMVVAAASFFSSIVFNVIERGEAEMRERNEQLAAVQLAATSLSSERELRPMLERFVKLSRQITDARYGALGILNADGSIAEFITSGMTDAEVARMAHPPVGRGLLGVILHEGASVRIPRISDDPRAAGFPPNHPPMESLLGVPVIAKGTTFGNLYLTDKTSARTFSVHDEEMVRLFAAHAAVAVETARLYRKSSALAVLEERERIGMDLHDGVIQSLYGVGLTLEDALDAPEEPEARGRIEAAVARLDRVMRDIRDYIYHLRPESLATADIEAALRELAREFEAASLISTAVEIDAGGAKLSPVAQENLLQIAREALANVAKHSGATNARITFEPYDGGTRLRVEDDGRGLGPGAGAFAGGDGHGLANMRERARRLGGTFAVSNKQERGLLVEVTLPLAEESNG